MGINGVVDDEIECYMLCKWLETLWVCCFDVYLRSMGCMGKFGNEKDRKNGKNVCSGALLGPTEFVLGPAECSVLDWIPSSMPGLAT